VLLLKSCLCSLLTEQLLKLSEYNHVEMRDKRLKDTVRSILSANFLSAGILKAELSEPVLNVPIV
jgi:hypothetical protein